MCSFCAPYFTFLSGVFILLSCRRDPSQLTSPSSLVSSFCAPYFTFLSSVFILFTLLHLPLWCLHYVIMSALTVSTYFTFLSGVFILLSCRRDPSQLTSPSSLVCSFCYPGGLNRLNIATTCARRLKLVLQLFVGHCTVLRFHRVMCSCFHRVMCSCFHRVMCSCFQYS